MAEATITKLPPVTRAEGGSRLDHWLSSRLRISRSASRELVEAGRVQLADRPALRPRQTLRAGERVLVEQLAAPPPPETLSPRLVFSDALLAVVDKPAGLVVHPGAGHRQGTLAQQLRGWPGPWAEGEGPERLGLVHRLDRGTSGLLVLARTEAAREHLRRQLRRRELGREYWALVEGRFQEDRGRIEAAVGRDPARPRRMAVRASGRPAATEFWVLERLGARTALRLRLETGRTHQIRVHLAYIGRPVVGDGLYGRWRQGAEARLALHAAELHLRHPEDGRELHFRSPLPADLQRLLGEADTAEGTGWDWPAPA